VARVRKPMKAPAFLHRFEGATQRAERASRTLKAPPKRAASVSDPIDEQIVALLEDLSPRRDPQGVVSEPEAAPARVVPEPGPKATAPAARARPRRQARSPQPRRVRRESRISETLRHPFAGRSFELRRPYVFYSVRQAFSGLAYALPRPYLSYTMRQALRWIAILLIWIAVLLFLVYLVST
jgi:hypothetical protein